MQSYTIASDHLRAAVKVHGAELCRLQTGAGVDLLWHGDPAVWGRQAPVLFPVVGALKDGRLRHRGRDYPMPKHGFARDRDFRMVRLAGHTCALRLQDDPDTRAQYPFPFQLDLTFTILGPELRVRYDLHNPGDHDLPASFGAHPAFRWPLLPGLLRESHWLEFEKAEGDLLPAVDAQGLLGGPARPSPLRGRLLALEDGLFAEDALVFRPVQSRAVRYSAPGAPVLQVAWDGFPHLGVWTKSGAEFLCIEPWRGHASPRDFDGEFADKPGVFKVRPGGTVTAQYTVTVLPPDVG
ncbi:MAG: aldose 1-epimerase family protein [Holophaga sp.]